MILQHRSARRGSTFLPFVLALLISTALVEVSFVGAAQAVVKDVSLQKVAGNDPAGTTEDLVK